MKPSQIETRELESIECEISAGERAEESGVARIEDLS